MKTVIGTVRKLKNSTRRNDLYETPFIYVKDDPIFSVIKDNVWMHLADLAKRSTYQNVPFTNLHTMQNGVFKDAVDNSDPQHRFVGDVRVVYLNNVPIVLDGNHRIIKEWLQGANTFQARVFNAGQISFKPNAGHEAVTRINNFLLLRDK